MSGVKIDIDQIFQSIGGRILVLLSSSGTILKLNYDALNLIGATNLEDVEGKKWDETYSKLNAEEFQFKDLQNAITGFISIEITEHNGDKVSLEVKVDSITLEKDFPGTFYLLSARKQQLGNWEEMLFQIMRGTEKDVGEDFIQSVTRSLAKTLKVDYAFIGKLKDSEEGIIETLSFWNKSKYRKNFSYELAGSPCEDVVNKKQKLISRNVTKQYPEDIGLVKLGVESYFGTPIYYSNGKPLGILVVMDSEYMEENSASAYILNIFASRIGAEIEWLETQKVLREKDRKLRIVLDAIPHPIFYKDKQGAFEGINKAFTDIVGVSEEKIIGGKRTGKKIEFLNEFDDQLLKKSGKKTYEVNYDDEHFLVTKSTVLDENDQVDGIVGSAMNINAQKQVELDLKINEEKYRTLFSSANDAIFIMNNEIFIDCNEKTLDIFGCKREEIIGQPPYKYSPKLQPDGRDSKEKALEKINDTLAGKSQNFYWKHKKKSGEEFDAEVSLNTFYIDAELFIQAIVRDVSEKEQLARNTTIQNERMEDMYKYISATNTSFREQIANLLEVAAKSLGMDVAIVSKIDKKKYTIVESFGIPTDQVQTSEFDLDSTYCALTFGKNRLVALNDISASKYSKHPALKLFKMGAYIGAPYWVKGNRYGTIAFLSKNPGNPFQPIDFDYVQMLAQWVGSTLERLQFDENLLERDALLETMLREIPIDFSVRNANLEMVIQSDLSKEYWGDNEGKPIDYKDIDIQSTKKWKEVFKRALQGEVIKGEDRVEIYGKPYLFYSIVSPVMVKDKVTEVIVINLDISKITETQEKLREQNEQLIKLNSELDRFVYSASHDLRAPLASLLGLIDLAHREKNADPTYDYLQLMSKSINTMDRFIADITEYSRNLRLDTKANEIDFNKLLKESFEQVQFMIPGPAKFEINNSNSVKFYSDYERLKIIISNLISNSLRYKGYDREPHVIFDVTINKKEAEIKVSDNGLGIPAVHQAKVFDMFYRASDKNVGSGLGLFIVKETVEKLRGAVSLSSKVDVGTTVRITLPNKPNNLVG